ncbi:MAG: PIG-L deacetylase family protein [Thermodesulfobacteriota bacterium]
MPGPFTAYTILGFYPHPDDEAYSAAGTMALSAGLGARVTMLCASRGEAGRHRSVSGKTGVELGAVRTRELEAACRVIGAEAPRFLDLPDGSIWHLDPDPVATELKKVLDSLHPQVVVTLGGDGAYGHLDHLACTGLMARAVTELYPRRKIRLIGSVFPRDLFRPLYERLKRIRKVPLDRRFDAEKLGTLREEADLCVNISSVRDVKLAAVGCHASQLEDGDPYSFMGKGVIDRILEEEWFVRIAGPAFPQGSSTIFDGL